MTGWTSIAELLPWLRGQGLYIAAAGSEGVVRNTVSTAGYQPVGVHTGAVANRHAVYASLANALRLPATAGTNLDAFADGLSDLADYWPGTDRIALLWSGAEALVLEDLLAWTMLAGVLRDATGSAWSSDQARPIVFETVVFVADGFGADHPALTPRIV